MKTTRYSSSKGCQDQEDYRKCSYFLNYDKVWDRYNERFGVTTMKREAFKSILGVIEDDNITRKKLVFRYLSNSYCFGLRKLIYRHIWNICP
jgi:hypothetical protein